jgi:hypothetical protein
MSVIFEGSLVTSDLMTYAPLLQIPMATQPYPSLIFTSTIHTPRGLSSDNTINIVFGIFASILGIFTAALAWIMWRGTRRVEGRGPLDDSAFFKTALLTLAKCASFAIRY